MDFFKRAWVEIDLGVLKQNYRKLCDICTGADVMAVVKADAYGHGAVPVAKALVSAGAKFFAVSNLPEALELRENGITSDILILGYTPEEYARKLAAENITHCVFSLDYAKRLNGAAALAGVKIKSHLKLDTGMGRIGFRCFENDFAEMNEAVEALNQKNLDFTGVFTHFSVADSVSKENTEYTKSQNKAFSDAVKLLRSKGYALKLSHCSNSAGMLTSGNRGCEATRAGIILYGIAPSDEVPASEGIKPVMSFYSAVTHIKTVNKGDSICYGRTYIADKKRKIATVSAGYADGVPRCMSNNGTVVIAGKKAPIVGRVCMDQLCVDVTDIPDVKPGDTVTFFGGGFSADEMAKSAGTITYEILCGISKRVERVYI